MLNLDLTVNLCKMQLGEKISEKLLQEAKLKKLGFWGGLFLKKAKGSIIYWSKNCAISCLSDRIILMPQLRRSDYIFMFGTSVFLYTVRGKTYRIVYQLLDNKVMAQSEFDIFAETASTIFGEPSKRHEKLCGWEDEDSAIISEIGHNEKNYFVYWILTNPKILLK